MMKARGGECPCKMEEEGCPSAIVRWSGEGAIYLTAYCMVEWVKIYKPLNWLLRLLRV